MDLSIKTEDSSIRGEIRERMSRGYRIKWQEVTVIFCDKTKKVPLKVERGFFKAGRRVSGALNKKEKQKTESLKQ